MDVRLNAGRVVQRSATHEPHARTAVLAEDRGLTIRTTEDTLHTAVVPRHVDRLRRERGDLDTVGLDQQIDDEGAAGLPLAVQAMTAMNEERLRRQAVSDGAACASALGLASHRGHRMPTRAGN